MHFEFDNRSRRVSPRRTNETQNASDVGICELQKIGWHSIRAGVGLCAWGKAAVQKTLRTALFGWAMRSMRLPAKAGYALGIPSPCFPWHSAQANVRWAMESSKGAASARDEKSPSARAIRTKNMCASLPSNCKWSLQTHVDI